MATEQSTGGWQQRGCVVWRIAVLGALLVSCRGSVEQPIAFNHKLHIEENDLECSDCHQYFETAEYSGLPRTEVCGDCHDDPEAEIEGQRIVAQYLEKGEQIPWNRVYVMPDHVFYSHRRHVVVGKIECEVCHGKIAEMTTPPKRPAVDQTMTWCMDCHEERSVKADCIHCHR